MRLSMPVLTNRIRYFVPDVHDVVNRDPTTVPELL